MKNKEKKISKSPRPEGRGGFYVNCSIELSKKIDKLSEQEHRTKSMQVIHEMEKATKHIKLNIEDVKS